MLETLKEYKKLLLIVGIIIVIFIIILLVSKLSSITNTNNSSYSELKETIETAVQNYCNDNCQDLLQTEDTVTVSTTTLVSKNYMQSLSKLTKDDSCQATITINKSYDNYNYLVNLNCGNNYQDKTIYDKVTEDNNIVTTGNGLYQINNTKTFRGEYVNNYLKLGNTLFRIVKINQDNSLTLVIDSTSSNLSSSWDDRYNQTVSRNDGINNFSISRVKEKLETLLSTTYAGDISKKAVNYNYCTGSRSTTDTDNSYNTECSSTYKSYISLLTVSDIINASLDDNCLSIEKSRSCQNYNYLTSYNDAYWLLTPVENTTNQIYYYDNNIITSSTAITKKNLRFVITISGNELYQSGTGTESDPYILS
jgi:hypothetical protein